MENFLWLLRQRRFWASLVSFVMFILSSFGVVNNINPEQLTDLLMPVGAALGALIPAILAIWSLLRPKNNAL